jgi:hypothetical protein
MVGETSCAILLCLGICPCRQAHREDRAFARLARHRDVAAHHASELAGDDEAQAGPAEPLGGRGIGLAKLLEHLRRLFRRSITVSQTDSSIQSRPWQ